MKDRIFLSPQSNSPKVRYYLSQIGTKEDLESHNYQLKEGLRVEFYCDDASNDGTSDDLLFEGTVHFDPDEKQWFALLNPQSFRHRSSVLND